MSATRVRFTLLVALSVLCLTTVSARTVADIFPWLFAPKEEPEPSKHEHPKLEIEELPVPDAPKVNWFHPSNKEFHSAILIAGSNGYSNYRHQSDVCHAFRILRERGLLDENIVTFVYDDIAFNRNNPYKGQVFNTPGGVDVYPGCAKDYTGRDVTRENVLAAMVGDKEAVKGKGSGRVLKKDPKQRIFMFYSDHGSVGTVGMPVGRPISGRDFNKAFKKMIEENFFKELVFYLESCESGSIFQGFDYDKEKRVYFVAASGAYESSYATYCPFHTGAETGSRSPNASTIGSCMGDLFSVSWMEYAEKNDISEAKIEEQLKYVNKRTSDDFTYRLGSHMTIYSDDGNPIKKQVVGNFLSYFDVPAGLSKKDAFKPVPSKGENLLGTANEEGALSMDQRDADLMYFVHRSMSNDVSDKDRAIEELQDVLEARQKADQNIRSIVQTLMNRGTIQQNTNGVEDYVTTLFPRAPNQQVVDDWDCFEMYISAWNGMCGELDNYSLQYTRAFANLCNQGVSVHEFAQATMHTCAVNGNTYSAV